MVTEVDLKINKFILSKLQKYAFPIVSEENDYDFYKIKDTDFFWVIDPLDGTMDFVQGTDDFSIMIGLVNKKGEVVFGAVYLPSSDELFFANKGCGAFLQKNNANTQIFVEKKTLSNAKILLSRNHLGRLEQEIAEKYDLTSQKMGSAGVKICKIAQGVAQLYINSSDKAGIWDLCAPSIIVKEAGGDILSTKGEEILFKQENTRLLDGWIVASFDIKNNLNIWKK